MWEKYTRINDMPFINKSLTSAYMKRRQLRNKYLKIISKSYGLVFVTQWSYYVNLSRKTKSYYYSKIKERTVVDNKIFWKAKLLSSKKKLISSVEVEKVIPNDKENGDI